jgi:DNA-binding MarR family transcriptional regulator
LRRLAAAEPLDHVLDVLQLVLEMLLVGLKPLEPLLAAGEATPPEPAKAAATMTAVLTPAVLTPAVLTPAVLTPAVLTPAVLTAHIRSPPFVAIRQQLPVDNFYHTMTIPDRDRDRELGELRVLLRRVLRGLWRRRRLPPEILELAHESGRRLGPRHLAVLAHIGTEGERTVGELARELGLSLPAASKLTRDLEDQLLVHRREHLDDRRRTVVALNPQTSKAVLTWLERRNRPLQLALDALAPAEREAFLKGLRALSDALMEESECGSLRPHHRAPHRRRPHRDRPV